MAEMIFVFCSLSYSLFIDFCNVSTDNKFELFCGRDDEQALLLLLQCGYSVEEALRRKRMNAGETQICS